jgi:hypothetical protein
MFSVAEPATEIFYGGTGHKHHKLLFTGQGRAARAAAGEGQRGLATCFFQQLPFYCIHFSKK